MSRPTADALRSVLDIAPHGSARQVLAAVDAALNCLPAPGGQARYSEAEWRALPEDLYEEHDLFFGAVRVTGNPVEILTRTMLESLRSQLNDTVSAGLGLGADAWEQLLAAYWAAFGVLWRVGVAGTAFESTARFHQVSQVRIDGVSVDPMVRWRLGHQTFFALIQALIATVGCLEEALAAGGEAEEAVAGLLLEDATRLMAGSGAAMRYAGDFTRTQYAEVVRPAMMPPHINPKFSGLQLRDHRILLKQLNRVKRLVESAGPAVHESYQQLLDAMSGAYDAHITVCARFGGDQEPSLRMPGSDSRAVQVLERFRERRTASITPERAAEQAR
ncbi:hypothetical protein [Kitasatospora sp. NPDC017646]|uniref:hypothetical protein n=1 Tax=Kitasatospora sp. NPDC017646 TaxID=3364024 RepID=UPI00379F6CF0